MIKQKKKTQLWKTTLEAAKPHLSHDMFNVSCNTYRKSEVGEDLDCQLCSVLGRKQIWKKLIGQVWPCQTGSGFTEGNRSCRLKRDWERMCRHI